MTPFQLRVRASKNIESAIGLLKAGDPDNACHLAGQAVELALKARYCTRRGIADFPDNLPAIRAANLQEAAIHNLDTLLTLAKGIEIPKYAGIDWMRVCEWEVVQRYDPVGTITNEQAASRVEESSAVVDYLSLHELLERLSKVRAELHTELNTVFYFFAIDINSSDELSLVIGGSAIWRMGQDAFSERLKNCVAAHADGDLLAMIDKYRLISPFNGLFKAYATVQQTYGGFVLVTDHLVLDAKIDTAYFVPAAGFNVGEFNSPSQMHGNVYL